MSEVSILDRENLEKAAKKWNLFWIDFKNFFNFCVYFWGKRAVQEARTKKVKPSSTKFKVNKKNQ
jgi:hypothetical protein